MPDKISSLLKLKTLEVADNQLQSLPQSIGALHELQHLLVAYNRLSSLPESIFLLPQGCHVGVEHNQLPEAVIRNLQGQQGAGHHPGPRIFFAPQDSSGLRVAAIAERRARLSQKLSELGGQFLPNLLVGG